MQITLKGLKIAFGLYVLALIIAYTLWGNDGFAITAIAVPGAPIVLWMTYQGLIGSKSNS